MAYLGLHHAGILTGDIERTVEHFAALLHTSRPKIVEVDMPGVALRTSMIHVRERSYLQIIEPRVGPGTAELEQSGSGAIYEIALEVSDVAESARLLRASGFDTADLAGNPFEGDYLTARSGNRYVYLVPHQHCGVRIELLQISARQSLGGPGGRE